MTKNHENPNPSGSEKILSRRKAIKVLGGVGTIAAAAVFVDACSAKKVPDAKQTTPVSSIGTEPKKPTKSPTPETQEIKIKLTGLEKLAEDLGVLEKEFEGATEEKKQNGEFYTRRMGLLIRWSHANHGFESKTFNREKGAWEADSGNYKEVQREAALSALMAVLDAAALIHACNKDSSLLPPETANKIMTAALDAFTGGYAKSKWEERLDNFKEYPSSIKTFIYGGTIEEGKLIEPFADYYGTRTRNNFNDKDAKDPDADLLSSGGMNAGGTHDTYDFFVPSYMEGDEKCALKITGLVVNTESEDTRYANRPAEKPVDGHEAPKEGKKALVYVTIVDARFIDKLYKTCNSGIHVVIDNKKTPICELPELEGYFES